MENTEVPITSLNLAAYLISEGFQLLTIRRNGNQAYFIFPDDENIQKHMGKYQSGDVMVPLPKFEFIRNTLLDNIRGGKR